MKVFLDTNLFINFLTNAPNSQKAKNVIESLIEDNHELCTSTNVIEEVLFILTRELLRANNIVSKQEISEYISKEGYGAFETHISKFISMLEDFGIKLIPCEVSQDALWEIMKECRLLPNDALIAAVCKASGIEFIATFDADFEKVDFLKVWKP